MNRNMPVILLNAAAVATKKKKMLAWGVYKNRCYGPLVKSEEEDEDERQCWENNHVAASCGLMEKESAPAQSQADELPLVGMIKAELFGPRLG